MNGQRVPQTLMTRHFHERLAAALVAVLFFGVFVSGVIATPLRPAPPSRTSLPAGVAPAPAADPVGSIAALPDLAIDQFAFTGDLANVPVGAPIGNLFSLSIRNDGSGSAGDFLVGLYASRDQNITITDTLLTASDQHVYGLSPGEVKVISWPAEVAVPASFGTGSAYLGVIVDGSAVISESNEANNQAAWAATLVVGNPQLKGQVVLPDGSTGVGDARVQIESLNGTPFADAFTDPLGYFEFWALQAGEYRILAYPLLTVTTSTPSLPVLVPITDTQTTRSLGRIALTVPNVFGSVVDPGGNPTGGARVVLDTWDGRFMQAVESDAAGGFQFGGISGGSYSLQAYPPANTSWAASPPSFLEMAPGVTDTNVGVISLTVPSVVGSVTDPDGVSGVGFATVVIRDSAGKLMGRTETDQGGGFSLGGLPAGSYLLQAYPPDREYKYAASRSQGVQVVSGTVSNVGTVPLSWTQVEGVVTDPDGTPDPYAGVTIWTDLASLANGGWHTDADWIGRFRFGGLDSTLSYAAQANPRRYESGVASSQPVTFTPATATASVSPPLTLTLRQADLDGMVVDDRGRPVWDALVVLVRDSLTSAVASGSDLPTAPLIGQGVGDALSAEKQWVPSDFAGFFAFGGLTSGTYWLQAFPTEKHPDLFRSDPVKVTVVQGTATHLSSPLVMNVAAKRLTVAVRRPDSTLVTDGQVVANQRGSTLSVSAKASIDGLYHLGLAGGEWEVSVNPLTSATDWVYARPPALVTFDKSIAPERKRITLTVTAVNAHVIGQILKPDDTPPLTGTVFVDFRDDNGVGNGQRTDGNGKFDVPLPAGTYHTYIYVLSGDFVAPELPPVQVEAGGTANLGVVHLLPMGSQITGKVTRDDTGEGVAGMAVKAWNVKGKQIESTTDATGHYTLTVSTGVWYVGVAASATGIFLTDVPPQRVKVDLPGQTVGGVDFVLTPAQATIQGEVVNEFGQLLPGVEAWALAVEANSTLDSMAGGGAVKNGQFSFRVPAGDYRVGLVLPPGSPYVADPMQAVTVASGEVVTLSLGVRAADAYIVGRFDVGVTMLGSAVPQSLATIGHVFAWGGDGRDWHSAPIYADGGFTLTVAAGDWHVGYRIEDEDYVAPYHQSYDVMVNAGDVFDLGTIPLLHVDSVITGVVQQPNADPFPGARVWAIRLAAGRQLRFAAESSEPDGTFTLRVPSGIYKVGAAAPNGSTYKDYRAPAVQTVATNPSSPVSVTLQFRAANAQLNGVVGYPSVSGIVGVEGAYLWGWSEQGAHVQGVSTAGGAYQLLLSAGTWHLGAAYQDESGNVFRSAVAILKVEANQSLSQDFALQPAGKLPQGRIVSFNADEGQVIRLEDGTEVRIPAGALADSGRVWVVVAPTVQDLPATLLAKPLKFGYSLQAFDGSGRQITGGFNKNVLISFHYDESDLPPGSSEDRIVPVYFSTTTDSWTPVESYVLDTVNNNVTAQINHFSLWMDSLWMDSLWMDGSGKVIGLPLIIQGG